MAASTDRGPGAEVVVPSTRGDQFFPPRPDDLDDLVHAPTRPPQRPRTHHRRPDRRLPPFKSPATRASRPGPSEPDRQRRRTRRSRPGANVRPPTSGPAQPDVRGPPWTPPHGRPIRGPVHRRPSKSTAVGGVHRGIASVHVECGYSRGNSHRPDSTPRKRCDQDFRTPSRPRFDSPQLHGRVWGRRLTCVDVLRFTENRPLHYSLSSTIDAVKVYG